MPMEAEDLAEMESMIAAARKKELNFAVCMGKKPEGTIFFLHRLKDGEVLARKAKKAGDTAKIAYGLAAVKGKKLNLKCAEDPPPNMARSMKTFLKDSGFPFKVYLLNMAGDVIDSDGEDDDEDDDAKAASAVAPGQEQDSEGRAATPGEEPEGEGRAENEGDAAAAPDPLAEQWAARVRPLGDLFAEAMTKNPPNRTQLEAAWAMANEKADALDFKAALVIADKMEPSLKGLLDQKAGAEADPLMAKYEATLGQMEALRARALAAEPPNIAQLEAIWTMMTGKAEAGDYKTALDAAAKLLPALEAAAVVDPNAAPWIKMEGELSPLYLEAMKQNPPDATKLQAAWAMAAEKAEVKDYAGAVRIGERLKPLLEAAANPAAGAASEIPVNVVAFQKSRLLWAKTRETMFSEMKKLENAIAGLVANDPDLKDIANSVNVLTDRLKPFDEQLEDILDAITNEADGAKREALKKEAIAKINAYRNELAGDFFQDVDANNGFTNVSVRTAANTSLESIAKVLAS